MQYNTSLLYRMTANMYIVYTCIYTYRSSHIICTYTWSTLLYTVHFRHDCTAVQHDSCTLRLYLRTVYILGKQHAVHIRLTVRCTWMKIQIYSTLLYGPWGNYFYTNENWKVALYTTLYGQIRRPVPFIFFLFDLNSVADPVPEPEPSKRMASL